MNQKTKEIIYKILFLGHNCSGKTSFIRRYIEDTFVKSYLSTVGLDFRVKKLTLSSGAKVKIQIWDSSGDERYNTITRQYFNRANGFIIMYNITRRDSFEKVAFWLREIRNYTNNNNIVLVGNCVDLDYNTSYNKKREISTEEGRKFAEDNNLFFFETSSLTGHNVKECFEALINRIYENDPNKNKIEFELERNRGKRGCLK